MYLNAMRRVLQFSISTILSWQLFPSRAHWYWIDRFNCWIDQFRFRGENSSTARAYASQTFIGRVGIWEPTVRNYKCSSFNFSTYVWVWIQNNCTNLRLMLNSLWCKCSKGYHVEWTYVQMHTGRYDRNGTMSPWYTQAEIAKLDALTVPVLLEEQGQDN